ncbi:MAG: AmmeMemoRadiSam system protein B [Acidobacteriota bacterium]|jgi:AmmeMemoRadiSam system protein B
MHEVRAAAVAGRFYPADPEHLRAQVDEMLQAAAAAHEGATEGARAHPQRPRAIIAPHAGYIFSGPVAATAFNTIADAADDIHRVVVIGPSHYVPFRGIALPEAQLFRTPLGDVELDQEGVARARELAPIITAAEPHRREHALEVELPFLQRALGDVRIVPLVTGAATPQQVADVLDAVWDDDTLLVVSSDLSHFHDYETAKRLDAATAEIIVHGQPEQLDEGSACGRLAIQGMKISAARRGMGIELLDLRNSGDTAGPRNEVVGYGAFRIDDED